MRKSVVCSFCAALAVFCLVFVTKRGLKAQEPSSVSRSQDVIDANADRMIADGRHTFRFDTFGDEAFWGDTLQLHEAIAGSGLGGIGPGVSPKIALALGLKVDVDALPNDLINALKRGQVNLDDPGNTVALLKLNSVVGVTGFFNQGGQLRSLGIQCAFCHSTVDSSFAPGIGHRLDGWANRDLNVGVAEGTLSARLP